MSSNLPFLPRSRRLRTLWLGSPFSAAFVARSRSFALAAKIDFLALASAWWMAVRALFLAFVGSTARLREAIDALLAISRGDESVSDILPDFDFPSTTKFLF